jgi:hypothetical protein
MVSASKRKAKSLKTRVTSRGSVTPGRGVENVGDHLPIHVAEWIVAVAFDIGMVADLLTDARARAARLRARTCHLGRCRKGRWSRSSDGC